MYYDGSHNDARMNISLAITSARHGANVANHVSVTDLVKNEEGKLIGAKMKDHITGQEWTTKAKSIINATGPFTDAIRKMDNQVSFPLIILLSNTMGLHYTVWTLLTTQPKERNQNNCCKFSNMCSQLH